MKRRWIIVPTIVCILLVLPLQAQIPPGRWEKVTGLQPGTGIIINLKSGDRLKGAFKSVGPDAMDLIEGNRERTIPKTLVRKIEASARIPDRLRNGAFIGMLVGIAGGIAGMIGFVHAATDGPVYWDDDARGFLVGGALVGGGIGAATGALLDASMKRHEVLYLAQ